ncbi:MAG: hypothetical protein ACI8Q1_002500 [Parvicella sp.]|jgi:hypothetical protein
MKLKHNYMLTSLFGKKRLTEDKLANVFVNSVLRAVEGSFADLAEVIANDGEFERKPFYDANDSDKFLMIVIVGNLSFLPKYFSNTEEMIIKGKVISKLGTVFGLPYEEMNKVVKEYEQFIYRVNHPSKNMLYGMSKAYFYKYNLGPYQDDYFSDMNAPNPILLKRMDTLLENYLWDWSDFLGKFKFSPKEA